MLMPKKNREKIYEYLFKEGVCVAKKDLHAKTHPHIEGIPNLHVIKAMQVRVFDRFWNELRICLMLCWRFLEGLVHRFDVSSMEAMRLTFYLRFGPEK